MLLRISSCKTGFLCLSFTHICLMVLLTLFLHFFFPLIFLFCTLSLSMASKSLFVLFFMGYNIYINLVLEILLMQFLNALFLLRS